MIRYILMGLALLASAGICAGAGGFESLNWLWLLPVGFAASLVGLIFLFFLVLWISCLFVDMEKTQEKDNAYFRFMSITAAQIAIWVLRMRVHTKGLEKLPKHGRFLLVCNHINDLDPVTLLAYFGKRQLAFISKRENSTMFLVGKLMHKIMCQLINRENDREALKTIITCIRLIQEDQVSIGVFPEGYVSLDRKLHPFRSGVFKVAQKAQVPIVVCTLQNTYDALPNLLRFKATDMHLHLVGVLQPEDYAGMSTIDLGNRIYQMMDEDLNPGG